MRILTAAALAALLAGTVPGLAPRDVAHAQAAAGTQYLVGVSGMT
jgi:uncharacterized membrane protein